MRVPRHPSVRLLAILVALTLALAACGTTSSPSPSGAAASPSAASPSAAPSSAAPSATASASASASSASPSGSAGAGPDLDDATTALEDLDAYELDMEVAGIVPSAAGAGAVVMEALFDRENDAVDFSITGATGLPAGSGTLRVIVIGDDAWLDAGTGSFIAQPGGSGTYSQLVESLSPESLLRQVPTEGVQGATRVGEEDRNGIPVVHYLADAQSSPELAEELGADAVMHAWVSTERGHIVALEMEGDTEVNGVQTAMVLSFDISRINDPTINIQPPG